MFNKQEAQQLRKDFWIAFGKSFPRKWILYDTKIKDFSFKFYADPKKAEVSLDIEMNDELFRNAYYEKIWSLEDLLKEEIGAFQKEEFYTLENGKVIARIWVTKEMSPSTTKIRGRKFLSFLWKKWKALNGFIMSTKILLKMFKGEQS